MKRNHPILAEVRAVLSDCGQPTSLTELYQSIQQRGRLQLSAWKDWQASVRAAIETHSSDSAIWRGRHDLFFKVEDGVWGLRAGA
jgi:hypothetical protein